MANSSAVKRKSATPAANNHAKRLETRTHIAVFAAIEIHSLARALDEENRRLDKFEDVKMQAIIRAFTDRLKSLSSVISSCLDERFDQRSEPELNNELTSRLALPAIGTRLVAEG